MKLTSGQSGFFDTVRGGGALYVTYAHTAQVFGLPYPDPLPAVGISLITAFFVLTGFLAHRILDRGGLRAFAYSRVRRVFPPLLCALALTVVLWAIAPTFFLSASREFLTPNGREGISLEYLLPTVALVNGLAGGTLSANGPLWTLAIDLWLYLFIGMFAAGGRWRWAAWLLLAAVLIRAPSYAMYLLAAAAGWIWSVLHARGRALVPSWRIGALGRVAPWTYALYITHFPLLLFFYGAWGERPWTAPFAFVLVVALNARFGPALERSGPAMMAWVARARATARTSPAR